MDKLQDIYMSMITGEDEVLAESDGTVKSSKIKAGDGFEGADKAQISSVKSPDPTEAEGVNQKKPVEGPSADAEASKPKPISGGKEGMKKEDTEVKTDEISMTFDNLYSKIINEEDEIVPAADIEGDEWNDDDQDLTGGEGEEEMEEEIDVASELRLLADRLTEIADKISGEDSGEMGEEEMDLGADEMGMGLEDELAAESANVQTEAIKSEPTPKPAKKTTLGPKMKQNPKNKIGKSGAKKATTPTAGKDRTGKPSLAPKTTFGPNMSQNPSGNGPAVKAGNSSLVN